MEELLLQAEILWPAMLAGLLVLGTHVPFGREVLQRGIIFMDLAIAQIAAFGVVLANTIGSESHDHHFDVPPTLIAIIAAIIGSLSLYQLRHLEVRIQEAVIGILFILSATGSILLLAADPHGGEQLKEILVGQILWLQAETLLPLLAVYGAILIIWHFARDTRAAWLFYPLFAVTITLSTQVVGVYLVFASLIIPSLATLKQQAPIVKAFVLGTLGYASGLMVAALFDLPAGATIVWALTTLALLYALLTGQFKLSSDKL